MLKPVGKFKISIITVPFLLYINGLQIMDLNIMIGKASITSSLWIIEIVTFFIKGSLSK